MRKLLSIYGGSNEWYLHVDSLLYNGYRVFPGGRVRPGRVADHSPPFSAAVMEEYSYTSTHPLGHTGPVMGSLYLFLHVDGLHTHQTIHMIIREPLVPC